MLSLVFYFLVSRCGAVAMITAHESILESRHGFEPHGPGVHPPTPRRLGWGPPCWSEQSCVPKALSSRSSL